MPLFQTCCLQWSICFLVLATGWAGCAGAPPQTRPAPAPPPAAPATTTAADLPPAAALSQAISVLSREARLAKLQNTYTRAGADFATAFAGKPDPHAVGLRIVRSVSSDPFTDAYVRWQLTSFHPTLPDLDDSEFQKLLDDLPRPLDNPRADSVLISELDATVRANPLAKPTQEKIQTRLKELDQRAARAEEFNRASFGLRAWLRDQLPQSGPRRILAALEECSALVAGGWNADQAKQRVETLCASNGKAKSLSPDDRRLVAEKAEELIDRRSLYVNSTSIQGESLMVEYLATAIDDFEVRRWMKLLEN